MYHALVVDDEPLSVEGMTIMVDWNKYGFDTPLTATSAGEALKIIEQNPPDLLITDLNMPGIDGVQLSEITRRQNPDMVIAYFSGYQDFRYAQKALSVGAVGYLLKPIDPEQVGEVLSLAKKELDHQNMNAFSKYLQSGFPDVVMYVVKQIAERYDTDISLSSLADELHITSPYLGQMIINSTGKNFAQLLLQKRMETAKNCLIMGETAGETAEKCGIGDVSYFSSQYKKYYGETPSQTVRKARE